MVSCSHCCFFGISLLLNSLWHLHPHLVGQFACGCSSAPCRAIVATQVSSFRSTVAKTFPLFSISPILINTQSLLACTYSSDPPESD